MQQAGIQERSPRQVPESRYAYYRRCQVFRKNGEQCKAPAEKGSRICHAHAGQQAMACRRERERQDVLAIAVTEMRKKGRLKCEAKDLFMDFQGIQVMLAVMAQALIDGRIDCKTAGRMGWQIQMLSRLLRLWHRRKDLIRAGHTDRKTVSIEAIVTDIDYSHRPPDWAKAA